MRYTIPNTQNPEWGFYGTMARAGHAEETWRLAVVLVSAHLHTCYEDARLVLDSAVGRHLADRALDDLAENGRYASSEKMAVRMAVRSAVWRWSRRNAYVNRWSMLEEQGNRVLEAAQYWQQVAEGERIPA